MLYNLYMAERRVDVRYPDQQVEVNVSAARAQLPELIERVVSGETIYLSRYGKRVCALVPAGAADYLEELEDKYWAARAEEALAEPGPSVPLAQVVAESEALD